MSSAGIRRVVVAAWAVSVVIATTKLLAMLASNTSALLASTIHSLTDASCLSLLLVGAWGARNSSALPNRAPDGALHFWSFVVAIPIYAMGGGIALYEGVERLARPQLIAAPAADMLTLAVAAAAGALVALMAMRELRSALAATDPLQAAIDQPELAAAVTVLVVAAATIAGNVLALGGLLTAVNGGDQRADPVAAIAVGLVMSAVAAFMAIAVKRLLIAASGPVAQTPPVLETKSLPPGAAIAASAAPPAAAASEPAQKPAITARQAGPKGRGKRRR